jgi:hypothetical protein
MADNDARPTGKLPGKNTTGGHDRRLIKANKNVSFAMPDRAKTEKAENDMEEKLRMQRILEADPRGNGHGRKYGLATFAVILGLRREGLTFEQIGKMGKLGDVRIPSTSVLYKLQESNPELREAWTKAYGDAVRTAAEETLGLARSLDKVKGLRGRGLVDARDKRIARQLQIARQRLPDEWGGLQEGEPEVIVFETYGGWVPTDLATGAPGQGPEGEAAAERWRKMREEAEKHNTLPGADDA